MTFSASYYNVNQAVAGLKANSISKVRSLAGLKKYRLGASVGTTSYNYIVKYIKPDQAPRVYDTVNDVVTALKNKQIDGMVHRLPEHGLRHERPGSGLDGRRAAPDARPAGALRASSSRRETRSCAA